MNEWGSIPDWVNVVLAFLALLFFIIVERERLILRRRNAATSAEGITSSDENQGKTFAVTEYNIDIRAELYSRILVGIILGAALNPIYSWAFSGLLYGDKINYDAMRIAEDTANIISPLVLSTIMSFIYLRASTSWSSVFVHWVERVAFSYIGFWFIFGFMYATQNYETKIYYLEYDSFINIFVSVLMLLLIGFPSTPIDWVIQIINKTKERKAG